ncbi:RNA polymerase sigma-70 factor [Catenulispora sp. NL8]|uniref:RNA polymerase sigma-70 factor n=2 Tax=Catenulispora pinistramenti TaxID=2705254 RepID=A0ABS5KZS2_9ACTN|nr:RNA polymerase sigma-70 factor [Catenulispora pinistramenti]
MSSQWRSRLQTPGGRDDQCDASPRGRDHRRLRGPGEDDDPPDARAGAGLGGGVVAAAEGVQGADGVRAEGRQVGSVGRAAGDVRDDGRGGARRVLLLPGLRVLHGAQPAAGRGQGAPGAALAGVRRVQHAGVPGDGLRGGDEPDAADAHRRAVGRAAGAAGADGDGGAGGAGRGGEHDRAGEHRPGDPVAGVLGGVRPAAAGHAVAGRSLGVVTIGTVSRGAAGGPDPFVAHRSLLFTVAYEMLGSAADAEDVVQETWLRWADVDAGLRAAVADPRAYLVRIVTRLALNRLRTVARRREEYFGSWLPEPLLTSPDVAQDVELAESVSVAMLTVLETLKPVERAVFVLREVFDTPYEEIARALGKTPVSVRQTAKRARGHVAARRPRMRVDREEQRRVVERFLAALAGGDLRALLEVLAPDVVVVADGGGVVATVRHPVVGAQDAAAYLVAAAQWAGERFSVGTVWLNGAPAARIEVDVTTALSFVVEDGLISRIYAVRNPAKLGRLGAVVDLAR